jgi:mono/diheme cytochrome c family protein
MIINFLKTKVTTRNLFLMTAWVLGAFLLIAGCSSSSSGQAKKLNLEEERGKRTFAATCAVCHNADSTKAKQGPGLKGMFHKKYLPSGQPAHDDRVRDTIVMGRRNMPAFGNMFDDQQVNDLIAYLHTL